jgi:hypothetical protein
LRKPAGGELAARDGLEEGELVAIAETKRKDSFGADRSGASPPH